MKVLRTIRFDASDEHVFSTAAGPDEWAISGTFAFHHLNPDTLSGKEKQAFSNGFLGLESFGRATFVSVGEADEAAYEEQVERLAGHLLADWGAPNAEAARGAARHELDFARELAEGQPLNTLLAVSRHFDDEGQMREAVRIVTPPTEKQHARIWDVVEANDA